MLAAARQIGRDVAGRWAADVDAEARFPVETVAELRRSGLLGALVPPEWGGPGLSLQETSAMVVAIAEHCASSGLILAMHHIQVASLVRHGTDSGRDRLLPSVVAGDLLLANANSEIGLGGERRTSLCALEPTGEGFRIEKQASTVSYGEYADGYWPRPGAPPTAQGTIRSWWSASRPAFGWTPTGDWDTVGLRGTCSRPARLVADVPADLVIADYADVFMRTSLPASAVLLSSVWLGIGGVGGPAGPHIGAHQGPLEPEVSDHHRGVAHRRPAAGRARRVPPPAARGGGRWRRALRPRQGHPEVETLRFSSRMDYLKLSSSTLVLEVVQRAMAICGLTGYHNQSPVSMSRIMRDAAAAPLMVNNDRALQAMAQTLLVRKDL